MPEEKVESSGFKVVDRRSFTSEGQRVAGQAEKEGERQEPASSRPPEPQAAAPAEPEPVVDIEEEEEGSERFAIWFLI